MAGLSVQTPSPNSLLMESPTGGVTLSPEWMAFLHTLQIGVLNSTQSGPTANRPGSGSDGRWIGLPFFDTTLGKPVWLKSVNPDVWVDATGTVT